METKTISYAAGLLIATTLLSRVLGVVRNGLLSWRFGAGEETDMYLAAFRVPDVLYGILIMGGISAVFLPVFSEYMQQNREEAWRFVSNLFNVLFMALAFLALVTFATLPFLMQFVAPGFSAEQQEITVDLARLMLLSPILLGVSAVLSGMLQYFHKFLAFALAPLFYNLGIIVGIVFFVPFFGVTGLAYGVILGAASHLLVQIPAVVRSGFVWRAAFDTSQQGLRKVFRLAVPRTISAAGYHLNLIVMTALASLISVGSITIFTYADTVQYFPVGIVGISFALAAFPSLSRLFAEQRLEQFRGTFHKTLQQIIFFVAPLAILVFLLRAQIVRLVYGTTPKFGWEETQLTAAVLGVFAFGILFQALIPFLARTFFSMQDTKTPTVISISAMALNIVLAVSFLQFLSNGGALGETLRGILKLQAIGDIRILALPIALVISGIVQALLLLLFLQKKREGFLQRAALQPFWKTLAALLVMVVVTYTLLQFYGNIFPLRTYLQVLGQMFVAGVGGVAVYFGVAFLFRAEEINLVRSYIRRKFV